MNSYSIILQQSSISHLPFSIYTKDFTFVVNKERFQTSHVIADLLSSKISKAHLTDPTINEYEISTQSTGNFQHFLDLINLQQNIINETEIQFFSEIIEQLETKISMKNGQQKELTIDNIIELLQQHEKSNFFYYSELLREIDFVSEHFSDIQNRFSRELSELSFETLDKILNNKKLRVDNEDQVLEFVNQLYSNDSKYSEFYKYVLFSNVEPETIEKFIAIFDIDHITIEMWQEISRRLILKVDGNENDDKNGKRYRRNKPKAKGQSIPYKEQFNGIFRYLQTHSNIDDEVNITFSSKGCGDVKNLLQFDDLNNYFHTQSAPNSWICFEFKKHRVIPTHYTIRSEKSNGVNGYHLKSWNIEGSNDNQNWTPIDEEKDNGSLNGSNYVNTFAIQNNKDFKYIRLMLTGPDWFSTNDYTILLNSIEFYGQLI
ncbi:hypothetical protein M9Y10_032423 [Tritrichomonas musculus]|uniref:F5/8 type C domain-containing protein n=1 Tax=Tritrichomonas musculus TaxID=1915356 RepID=A0ABR2GYE1_9EUKA